MYFADAYASKWSAALQLRNFGPDGFEAVRVEMTYQHERLTSRNQFLQLTSLGIATQFCEALQASKDKMRLSQVV